MSSRAPSVLRPSVSALKSRSAGVDRYGEIIQADGNVWDSVTVMRPDTDILYYDLSDLSVQITPQTDGKDGRYQAFAWKGASKFLEFEGGDLTKITYDEKDKILTLDTILTGKALI